MRTIRISGEVWDEIANRGVFGETPDDVLRREFGIEEKGRSVLKEKARDKTRSRAIWATDRLSSRFENNCLVLEFASGVSEKFPLPEKWDKDEIRNVTANVMLFIKENGGTQGQINAGRKALTDEGYHIQGPVHR